MQKICITLAALLCLSVTVAARSQALPAEASIRYSFQLSNGPTGSCNCFVMQGASGDLLWHIKPVPWLGMVADFSGEHTGNINNAGYGLTLTTYSAGPRLALPAYKVQPFLQLLLGVAHGSGSQFPENGVLVTSANSLALDFGVGADYPINKRLSARVLQLDYLRTTLPNNTNNWQNNLRVGAGLTLNLGHKAK